MPFPINSDPLDDFNVGASQNLTIRRGWRPTVVTTGDASWVTNATPAFASGSPPASNLRSDLYSEAEAWVRMNNTVPTSGMDILARITAIGASPTAYTLNVTSTTLQFFTLIAGTFTAIGGSVSQTVAAGESVGFSIIGSTLTAYYKTTGGSWVSVLTTTDSQITGLGSIGFLSNGGCQITDFGGGSAVPMQAGPANFNRRSGLVAA